jgi:hypothetical protein
MGDPDSDPPGRKRKKKSESVIDLHNNKDLQPKKTEPDSDSSCKELSDIDNNVTFKKKICNKYTEFSSAPYIVNVVSTEKNKPIHPMTLGGILFKNGIQGVSSGGVRADGRKRITISFETAKYANEFVENKLLETINLNCFIPNYKLCKNGIVRYIPVDLKEDEILANISVPPNYGKVIGVKRLKRRDTSSDKPEWVDSSTVLLTFEGQNLPEKVFLFYNSIKVLPYIYPCNICKKCLRYGHSEKKCTSTQRCANCGDKHDKEACPIKDSTPKCLYCQGEHLATDTKCPEFARQKEIKRRMANESISFAMAAKLTPPSKKFYSEAVTSTSTLKHTSYPKPKTQKQNSQFQTNINKKEIDSLLFYKNGQLPQPSDGCALISKDESSCRNSDENDNSLIIQLLTHILTVIQTNKKIELIKNDNVTQCVQDITKEVEKINGV